MRPPLALSCRSRTECGRRGVARAIAYFDPECRTELPIEQGKNARLSGVKDDIIETKVAVRQGHHTVIGGHMRLEPLDELVHLWHCPRLGRLVLLHPAVQLPCVVVAHACRNPQAPAFAHLGLRHGSPWERGERKQDEPCRVARASFVAS